MLWRLNDRIIPSPERAPQKEGAPPRQISPGRLIFRDPQETAPKRALSLLPILMPLTAQLFEDHLLLLEVDVPQRVALVLEVRSEDLE